MAFSRYKDTDIKRDEDTKNRVYKTTLYPLIKPDPSDSVIISKAGDRLDLLAYRYYGDPSLWWVIAHANRVGKGTLSIPVGTKLRIPVDISLVAQDLKKINQRG